ncbi:hypothetical protein TrST_g6671 [Triparma strigata]|uniref:Translation initiation factor IF-3 n=2 Tax=Triparma strigata TaxID=1606541 RepID=A0A9W7BVS1_9STRA|nr:hypothetical protein TrST_g6671 [Triparma strigata]
MQFIHLLLVLLPLLSSSFSPFLVPSSHRISTSLSIRRGGKPRGPLRTIEVKPPMNSEIKTPTVRVTAPSTSPDSKAKDEVLGVMDTSEALALARERSVDLILINDGEIPVCKLVEYSKWRYMKEKKAKEVKKNSKSTEVKEVKMSYKIDVGDLNVRRKNALKFLKQGNRVKLSVQFKGREQSHIDLGYKLLSEFSESEGIKEWGVMDGKPKREGRQVSVMMSVRAERVKKERELEKAEERRLKKLEKMKREEEGGEEEPEEEPKAQEEAKSIDVAELREDDEDDEEDDEMEIGAEDKVVQDLFG